MSSKRNRSPSPITHEEIYRSESVEDQKSVFIAAFSHSLAVKALQRLPEFQSATNRIAAWRKRSRQQSLTPGRVVLYDAGYDDDGEKWAGARLKQVLEDMKVEGVVVVARWYGGQNIGPIRFTHIENTAKEAIWRWKAVEGEIAGQQAAKKQKVEEEAARERLEDNLRQRDYSIFILRGLLADKTAKLNGAEATPPTPQKGPPDYSKMTMDGLKKMDKARDATIAFILKQIDKVDKQLEELTADDNAIQEQLQDGVKEPTAVGQNSSPKGKESKG